MFINTRKEARTAARIAAAAGFTALTSEKWYKRYTTNVLAAWANESSTRELLAKIASAIRASRAK